MSTYKLIQDIEAEDHILGPLTLKQFIFALIAAFFGYLDFIAVSHHVSFLLALFAPPTLFFIFFAFPFGRDQPTEIWFLAKLRFWFLPRKRIWNQSGVRELVTITAPKKVEQDLTKGLSDNEVKSRLQALSSTLDTRGWAVKNVGSAPQPALAAAGDAQRLINLDSIPQPVAEDALVHDMLDPDSSQEAQQVNEMVNRSEQVRHQQLVEELRAPLQAQQPAQPSWFTSAGSMPAAPVQELKAPVDAPTSAAVQTAQIDTSTATPPVDDPTILSLANNDDLDVATLAREANRAKERQEVVIKLH